MDKADKIDYDEDSAREIVEIVANYRDAYGSIDFSCAEKDVLKAIRTYADVKLEEAAKLVEAHYECEYCCGTAHAEEIRALKSNVIAKPGGKV